MGSPFDTGTWTGVDGTYFAGAGGASPTVWLIISMALCVLAMVIGARHEKESYKKSQ